MAADMSVVSFGSALKFNKKWKYEVVEALVESEYIIVVCPFNKDRFEMIEFLQSRDFVLSNGLPLPEVLQVPIADGEIDETSDGEAIIGPLWDFKSWERKKNRSVVVNERDYTATTQDLEPFVMMYNPIQLDMDRWLMGYYDSPCRIVVFVNKVDKILCKTKAVVIDSNE